MRLLILGAMAWLAATAAAAGQAIDITPTVVQPTSGRQLFIQYCAPCHGRDGTGSGPAAAALTVRPTNLTRLSSANKGRFPLERVRAFVGMGSPDSPAHGTREMPVWGPVFRALDSSDKEADARIDRVVRYVRSMQRTAPRVPRKAPKAPAAPAAVTAK
jgi:mono/diheme cytochrome c family protein